MFEPPNGLSQSLLSQGDRDPGGDPGDDMAPNDVLYVTDNSSRTCNFEASSLLLACAGCGAALLVLLERVTFKVMVDATPVFSFLQGLLALLVAWVVMLTGCLYRKLRGKNRRMSDMPATFNWKLIGFGLLDATAYVLLFAAGSDVPGPLTVGLSQVFLPALFLATFKVQRDKVTRLHVIGAAVIGLGVVLGLLPMMARGLGVHTSKRQQFASVAFLCSAVVSAVSAAVRERSLRRKFVDPFLLQTVVLGIVIVLAIFVAPIVLTAQGHSRGWSYGDLISNAQHGFACFRGEAQVVGHKPELTHGDCKVAVVVLAMYCVAITVSQVALPFFSARLSATATERGVAVGLLVSFLLLELHALQPHNAGPWPAFPWTDILCWLALLAGNGLYYWQPSSLGEYETINNDFPEDLEFRVPVRETPVGSFLFQ